MQANEAIERLRDMLAELLCFVPDSYVKTRVSVRDALAATATIDPAPVGAQDGGWISVDERLPDESGDVLVLYWPYDNHENAQIVGQAHYHDGGFYDDDGNDWHPPSHWMPLPPPPAAQSSIAGSAKGGSTIPEVPTAQPAADHALICPTCRVDRLKETCPSLQSCGMTGTASHVADHAKLIADALELAHDLALEQQAEIAARFEGYKPEKHAAAARDVALAKEALLAWKARGQQAGVPKSACCNNNCNQGRNCPERK